MKEILKKLYQIVKILYEIIYDNFSFKRTFNFSNFLKLCFIYSATVFWVIIIDFNFSPNFFNKLLNGKMSENRIAIYSVKDRIGEAMLYNRILKVARENNIDYTGTSYQEIFMNYWLTSHFYIAATNVVNYIFKPNFNLALTHHVKILPNGYNVTYLNMPNSALFDFYGYFYPEWKHLAEYDAYIDLYSFVHGHNKFLDRAIELHKLKNKKIVSGYLAQEHIDYSPPQINEALITGTLWGCNRNSLRIVDGLHQLAIGGYLVGYGVKHYLGFLEHTYYGSIEDFGDANTSIIQLHKEHGISLILHNLEHMLEGIPTNRIGEAAMSGTLIITDHNKFIEKYFGDNVLYFDQFADGDKIFQQISEHIEWAKSNSSKAINMGKKAYDIFDKDFTIDKQLPKIMKALSEK